MGDFTMSCIQEGWNDIEGGFEANIEIDLLDDLANGDGVEKNESQLDKPPLACLARWCPVRSA